MYIHTRRLKMKAAKTAIDSIPIQCSPSGRAGPAPMAKLCLCKHKAAPQRKKLLGMSPDVATGKKSKHHSEYHGTLKCSFPSLNVFIMWVSYHNYGVFSSKNKNFNILQKWPKHLVVKRPLPASGIFDGSTSKPPVSPRLRSRGDLRSKGDNGGRPSKKN